MLAEHFFFYTYNRECLERLSLIRRVVFYCACNHDDDYDDAQKDDIDYHYYAYWSGSCETVP